MITNDSLCKENINNNSKSRQALIKPCIKSKSKSNKTKLSRKIMTMMLTEVQPTHETVSDFLPMEFGRGSNNCEATMQTTLHMTLEEIFRNSSTSSSTQQQMQPNTAILPAIILNKPKLQLQHKQQQEQLQQHQQLTQNSGIKNGVSFALKQQPHSTVSPSDPTVIVENATATTLLSTIATATAGTASSQYVANSKNGAQCNDVCISSNGSPEQKCAHQQKQQVELQKLKQKEQREHTNQQQQHQPSKSTNISCCTSISNICTAPPYTSIANATNATTNNITGNNIIIINSLSKPPTAEASLSPLSGITTAAYNKAHPLRRICHATIQIQCMLRAVMFSFVFIMSLQYQSVTASTSMTKHEPMFISRSETFKFVAGDTIVLPCEVANTDPYVVAWKRGIAILTAGSVKVTPDPRVRLINGFNLQIRDAVPQDAGDYICQIATMEPREITHTVEILVPPRIHHISTSGHLQVKKGSSVRIECSASGNPTPNVTWSRKNNILPNGEEKLHSHVLSIENVDRHKGGVYICTANNGVGQPASSQVVLHVLYPPEITLERPIVFSGEGHEAMLVCIVHGETQPEVIWFKDTMQLDTTERHIMENRGSRHTLIIRKVHPQDFGNYSCVAENQLGKSRKTLQLSGKPNVAVFNSPPISQYKDRYNISWTVESHSPIEEYKLSFRRLQQGQEVDNSIDSNSPSSSLSSSSSSIIQMYGGSMGGSSSAHNYRLGGVGMTSLGSMNSGMGGGGYGSYGAGNIIHWGRNDWRDVVLPAIPISHHYTQGMSYMIRGLDPDQHYEATVQARNRYGWSDYSRGFLFSTSSNGGLTDLSTFLNHGHLSDNEMRDLSVTFYGSRSSCIEIEKRLTFAILAMLYSRYVII